MKSKGFYLVALGIAASIGCNNGDSFSQSSNEPEASISMDMPPPPTVEIHEHPGEGPHHGSLIELGKEEYHAEFVHDNNSVMIFVLDSAAIDSVPVDASEVMINVVRDGKPEQFKLAAAPEASDPIGKSSRFITNDSMLATHLDDSATASKLSITINGKSYRGTFNHEHEHEHKHGHEHGHDHALQND